MQLLFLLLSMLALFCLCAALTLKGNIPASVAPLTALSIVALWLTAAGMAGGLEGGVITLFLVCFAAGAWALWPGTGRNKTPATGKAAPDYRALLTPASVLFWGMALGFAVYFYIRQPMATVSDELTLWGPAVKITKLTGQLYSVAEFGTPWAVTQNPGLPLISYFFQFFGSYADWKIYVAYNTLTAACYAAVLGALPFNRYRMAVPAAAVLWFAPFFLTVYNHTIYLDTTYLSAYGDVPAGLVVGGAVAAWLSLRRADAPKWAVLPILALCANIKANTFVLALVAAGLVALDAWVFPERPPFKKGLARRTGFALACFAAPLAVYYAWNLRYVGWLVARNAQEGGMGETSAALSQVVVNGIKILLGQPVEGFFAERQPQFLQAMADMGHQFWTNDGRLSMIGCGRNIVLLILGLFAVGILVAGSARLKARIAAMSAASLACFGGYNLMLALSYGFIFVDFQAQALADYNRYIQSYYLAWFLMALACLLLALQPTTEKTADAVRFVRPHCVLLGQGVLLALAAVMVLRQNQMVLPQLSVLGFSDSEFTDRKAERAEADLLQSYLQPGDRVFYVSQGDNGEGWFSAAFDLYPTLVDYSGNQQAGGGGGTFGLEELRPEGESTSAYYFHPYTAEELDATVRQSGSTVLYIQRLDDIFVESYAELFTDRLASALAGETLLYRVSEGGFEPVKMNVGLVAAGEVAP